MTYCDWCARYYDSRKWGIRYHHHDGASHWGTEVHVCSEECKGKMDMVLSNPAISDHTQKLYKWGNIITGVMKNGKLSEM